MKRTKIVCVVMLLISFFATAQRLSGCIKDADTGEAIPNVAVYLAGTSIGVVSGLEGCFEITYRPDLSAAVVFSALGYEKISIENPLKENLSVIKLIPKVNDLETVYLNPDPWTRAEKERWFKKIFIGEIPEAASCVIQNINDVRLRFNPATGILTAVCDVPVIVNNKHLGFTILYDLLEFEAVFTEITLNQSFSINNKIISGKRYKYESAFVAGSAFFKELEEKKPSAKRRGKRRETTYEQSTVRFFRSLTGKTFEEDGYILYHKGFKVALNTHVRIRNSGTGFMIEFRENAYSITDNSNLQSALILAEQRVVVDAYGNNLSPRAIQFGGHFAILQVAGLLPLEYGLDDLKP